jgi:hypothetical protein
MATTTVIEKKGSSVIYRADKSYNIPNLDLLTLLFGMYALDSKIYIFY